MADLFQNFDSSKNPQYSLFELSRAIQIIPNTYGRVRELGLFSSEPITTRTFSVEFDNGVLNMLPSVSPGAPATLGISGKRSIKTFIVPHIPHNDSVKAEDIQGVREFGTTNEFTNLNRVLARKLATMRNKHAITLEFMRMSALKGIVVDGSNSTLVNLYTEFGVTQKTVDFVLGTTTTDVRGKCMEVVRHIEDNLKGETMTGVRALVSPEFMDALTNHTNVKDAFMYQSSQMLREDIRKNFVFGGITFEEYRGVATDSTGVSRKFITAQDAVFFPVGTQNTFQTYFCPADYLETVNTPGQEMYAKTIATSDNRALTIQTQMNPLPLCLRPALLVRGYY